MFTKTLIAMTFIAAAALAGCQSHSAVRVDADDRHLHTLAAHDARLEPGGALAADEAGTWRLVAGDELGVAMFQQYLVHLHDPSSLRVRHDVR
ncbi:MAG: hypothetical protein WD118_09400 [Phycisphaeraceae bacterium]